MDGAAAVDWPPLLPESQFSPPSKQTLESRFATKFNQHKTELQQTLYRWDVGNTLNWDHTFKVASKSMGSGKGAMGSINNELGQCVRYIFSDSESMTQMLPMWFDLYDSMTKEQRMNLRYAWSDSCCMGRSDPTTHPVAELFENVKQVYADNWHAQHRLNVDICENHPDFAEFIRRRRDVFWEPLPLEPLRNSANLVDQEYCRVFDHI